jgi:hypothetical protein
VSVGGAGVPDRGFLGVWNVADGRLISGSELALGAFYAVAVSGDGKLLAVATGAQGRPVPGANNCYVLKMPDAAR